MIKSHGAISTFLTTGSFPGLQADLAGGSRDAQRGRALPPESGVGLGATPREANWMDGIAWDVYYLYGPNESWDEDGPTSPGYWEHQLGELDPDRHLSYDIFKGKVLEALDQES